MCGVFTAIGRMLGHCVGVRGVQGRGVDDLLGRDCSCCWEGLLSAIPRRLDIEGREHFAISSIGGDGGG